jgi:hypothetical protein
MSIPSRTAQSWTNCLDGEVRSAAQPIAQQAMTASRFLLVSEPIVRNKPALADRNARFRSIRQIVQNDHLAGLLGLAEVEQIIVAAHFSVPGPRLPAIFSVIGRKNSKETRDRSQRSSARSRAGARQGSASGDCGGTAEGIRRDIRTPLDGLRELPEECLLLRTRYAPSSSIHAGQLLSRAGKVHGKPAKLDSMTASKAA